MSDAPQNPYSSPNPSYAPKQSYPTNQPNNGQRQPGLGFVRQIPILAIMTIVQGALLFLMALACTGYALFFSIFFQQILPEAERAKMQAEVGPTFAMIGAIGIGIGAFILVISILHIIAGMRGLNYRGRVFIIVTWFLGLIASFTGYCAPTSIGLAIWGLIVFFNPAVKSAFKMVEDGMDKREVERQFY